MLAAVLETRIRLIADGLSTEHKGPFKRPSNRYSLSLSKDEKAN